MKSAARVFMTRSAAETEALGEQLAREVRRGDVLCLYGELGAGKTCLVAGLARGLQAGPFVSSPTFTLIHEYSGPCPLYHFDLYRLQHAGELEDIGYEEYFYGNGVTVVEWAEKAAELLPARRWDIRIEIKGGDERRVRVSAPPERNTFS